MKAIPVTLVTLPRAVAIAMAECQSHLTASQEVVSPSLARDLNTALNALRLIESELNQRSARPKQQRSGAFTRYVVDEGPSMAMDPELREFIVRIEAIYKRCDVA